ncbi:TPA: hypothetical protein GXZ34_01975 [bacterium]|nr:hypothetical protein [bacterium]
MMKLFELLQEIEGTDNILVNNKWALGIKWQEGVYYWADKEGNKIPENIDITGYKRVILSSKLFEENEWKVTVI